MCWHPSLGKQWDPSSVSDLLAESISPGPMEQKGRSCTWFNWMMGRMWRSQSSSSRKYLDSSQDRFIKGGNVSKARGRSAALRGGRLLASLSPRANSFHEKAG